MKKNLILNSISLVLTSALLIVIVLAWYVTNDEATVTGVTASTASNDIWDITLDRYIANEDKDTGSFTYDPANSLANSNVNPMPFDFIAVHDKIIYKITFKTTQPTVTLTMKNTNSSRSEKFTGKQTAGADTEDTKDDAYTYYNFLSNVADFSYLTASGTGDAVTLTIIKYPDSAEVGPKNLTYSGDIAEGSSQLVSTELVTIEAHASTSADDYTEVSVYFLYDYDQEDINRLFTANLGTEAANSKIYFREDIEFILS